MTDQKLPQKNLSNQKLTTLERNFINHFQGNFPLAEHPFESIAAQLDCSEDQIIDTVRKLKENKIITRFGPLYDAAALGGGLTLAALSVPEEQYESVTRQVNRYHQVAHNYRREHELNMWFVLATETPQEIEQVLQSIEQDTKLRVYNFPKQHEFYIGLWLSLSGDGSAKTVPVRQQIQKELPISKTDEIALDDIDRHLIRITQQGLPIEHSPYATVADIIGISQQEVFSRLQQMQAGGVLRRIGAVPNHYRLGLTANGMTVWNVDESRIIDLGNLIGQLDFVSHCYQRPRHLPLWPYNLFAMVHGHTRAEVDEKTECIASLLGTACHSHDTLFSTAILKKTGLRLAA